MPDLDRHPRLSILWTFVHPHRRALVAGFLLGLLATGIGLGTPLAVKWVIDSIGTRAGLSTPVLVLFGLLVVGTLVSLVQWVLLGTVAERVVLDARSDLVPACGTHSELLASDDLYRRLVEALRIAAAPGATRPTP